MDSANKQTAVVAEVTQGTTPTSPGFKLLRDSSVTGSPQRGAQRSPERRPDRMAANMVSGLASYPKSINMPLVRDAGSDILLEIAALRRLVDQRPQECLDQEALHARGKVRRWRHRPLSPPRGLPLRQPQALDPSRGRRRSRHADLRHQGADGIDRDSGARLLDLCRTYARR